MTPVPPRIYLQDTCLKHRFIRSKETGDVYERPERIRAVNIGIAALYARLESANPGLVYHSDKAKSSNSAINGPLTIIRSASSLDMRVHRASLAIHSGEESDGTQWYLADDIEEWCVKSLHQIQHGLSEIPEKYEQDLYLCPESLQAFEAALGTVCEAVDHVCRTTGVANEGTESSPVHPYTEVGHPSPRAFVVIRPPGHHCGEDSPAGFGFVNNVAVGAFHAFEEHRLSRVVIFDIDLHHGNGTQELVRAYQTPKIYYGSMHDILSYPCEAGNQELINDASIQLHGVDGEWIHNVHILPYKTEQEFWRHYKERYTSIFTKAEEFLNSTGGPGDDIIVFMSCGFDASEYETAEMSRHDRHVPTSFYHRFTREACAFADKWSGGRLVSVLEGGYADKALTSGAISHIAGLAEAGGLRIEKEWWSNDELNMIDKVTAKRRGRRPKLDHFEWWLQRMQQVFQNINKDTPPVQPPHASQLWVPPPPPPPREETPDSTPQKMRKRRMRAPLPPPTSIVTRKSKRSSPEEYEHMELSATKKRRVQQQDVEEEEESSDEDMEEDQDEYKPPPSRVDKGKGRVLSSPEAKISATSEYTVSGDMYRTRTTSGSSSSGSGGLPTPLPSLENIRATAQEPGGSTQRMSTSELLAHTGRTQGVGAASRLRDRLNRERMAAIQEDAKSRAPPLSAPELAATQSSARTPVWEPFLKKSPQTDVKSTPTAASGSQSNTTMPRSYVNRPSKSTSDRPPQGQPAAPAPPSFSSLSLSPVAAGRPQPSPISPSQSSFPSLAAASSFNFDYYYNLLPTLDVQLREMQDRMEKLKSELGKIKRNVG